MLHCKVVIYINQFIQGVSFSSSCLLFYSEEGCVLSFSWTRFGHQRLGWQRSGHGPGWSRRPRNKAWSAEVEPVQPVTEHNITISVGHARSPSAESLIHPWN